MKVVKFPHIKEHGVEYYSIPAIRDWIYSRIAGDNLDGKLLFLQRLEAALNDVRKVLLEVK